MAAEHPESLPRAAPAPRRRGAAAAAAARRRRKLVAVGAALLVLGFVLYVLSRLVAAPPQARLLTVAVSEPGDPLAPVNAFAIRDSDLLAAAFPDRATRQFGHQTRDDLLKTVRDLADDKTKSDQPIVVHLCALAWAGADDVYLLTGDDGARLGDETTALSLKKWLEELKKCKAPKLLLLDVTRPTAGPFNGVLLNDVAERARQVVTEKPDPDLAVLLACSPGQLSLTSPELGHSVFAHYVALGLGGAADGYPAGNGDPDGRVSAGKLATYVSDKVERWAEFNAGRRQTPLFVTAAGFKDFSLTVVPRRPAPPAEDAPAPPADMPGALQAAWQEYEKREPEARRLTPRALRQFEAALLRTEQRAAGGAEEKEFAKDLEDARDDFARRLDAALKEVPRPAAQSLARAAREGKEFRPDPKVSQDVSRALLGLDALDFPAAAPAAKAQMERDRMAKELAPTLKDHPKELAYALAEWLARQQRCGPNKLALVDDLLQATVQSLSPPRDFVEVEHVHRLRRRLDGPPMNDPELMEELLRHALRGFYFCEQAANGDPRAVPIFHEQLQAAAAKRRDGERALFKEVKVSLLEERALPPLTKADDDALGQLSAIEADLARAFDDHDEALALLTATVPYFIGLPDENPPPVKGWDDVLKDVKDLRKILDTTPVTAAEVARTEKDRSYHLAALRGPFESGKVHELIDASRADPPKVAPLREMNRLLGVPCLKFADRAELWKARGELAWRLWKDTDANRKPDVGEAGDEQARGQRRAELARGLLTLAGGTGAGAAPRHAWEVELPKRLAEEKDLLAADRLGRILLPAAGGGLPPGRPEATTLLRRRQETQALRWLAESYRDEAALGAGSVFSQAAKAYESAP